MKTMKKIVCALMTLVLLLSSVPTVFADEADTKAIDQDAACSLTIWKFDYTNAKKDGVWDEDAFPSTGWQESYVENALVNTNRKGDTDGQNGNALGNGQTSKGYAIAKRNDEEGVYYVTGHTDKEADATVFTPVTMGKSYGHIMVKGLEEDTYTITETQTANGYTLLKNAITVTISLKENTANTCNIYAKDVLGVLQNDPHYAFDGGEDLKLANIPQRVLSHNYPTASATVDKNDVTMLEDNGSANAEVPLTVKNTKGFDLPKTGDHGTWMYSLVGILLMSAAAGVIVLTVKKKNGR